MRSRITLSALTGALVCTLALSSHAQNRVIDVEFLRNAGATFQGVGSNDWAAAWAVDPQGRYMASPVPGGNQQREMAYRFGVNLTMYAFTGNYKADQVHIPAILERLGQ